jgi:ABC-type glycerol-3-phosphate transport system permease component
MLLKGRKKFVINGLVYILLIIFVFLINLPTLSMVGTALKSRQEALSSSALLPREFHFENFIYVLGRTTFSRNLLNSFLVAIIVTLSCIIVSSLAGYAISRFKSRFMSMYSTLLLVLQMFPGVLLLIPLFVIYKSLGLIDNTWSVILSYTTMNLPFSIWMLKGFFDTIPFELEESAMIDGSSQFRAYYSIVLPISMPGISTVGIFTFINAWNEYMLASIFLRSDEVQTLTVGLEKFVLQYSSDWASLMAASTIATIPTLIFLLFAQRYLIEGLTAGAVKG